MQMSKVLKFFNKPAHELFARVTHKKLIDGPAREYSDYETCLSGRQVYLDGKTFPETFKVVKIE
jgi:hypothetical protein